MLWDSRKKIPGMRDNWGGGFGDDGKMHARNSFLTDFSMSSPLSTLKFLISFYILYSSLPMLRNEVFFIYKSCYFPLEFRNICIILVFNNIGSVFSLGYIDIPNVFFTPYHIGRFCTNVIRCGVFLRHESFLN